MNEQLLDYLFDDNPHPHTHTHLLAPPMSRWIGSSRRFKAFATTYRDKIRKKIRITQGTAGIQDLEAELETACWLLQDRRFTLAYEPYGSQKTRGPDFAITFKSTTFNVEVTRIRSTETEPAATPPLDPQHTAARLIDTVCDKLGQMRPGMINVLVVVTDGDFIRALDLYQAMARLKERAERQDPNLFSRHRFASTAAFFKLYLRLSAGLVRTPANQDGTTHSLLWTNNQARHALPGPIRTILQR